MQTYRIVPRSGAPRACRAACSPAAAAASAGAGVGGRNIFSTPFFPARHQPQLFNPIPELAPFFRVLDSAVADLVSTPERHQQRRDHRRSGANYSSFTPRFDVREAEGSYELQGDLPGLEQKDLAIEFVDEKTLVVRGSSSASETVSEHESSSVNADRVAATATATPTAPAADKATASAEDTASEKSANTNSYHKATVEAEDEDDFVDAGAEAETETETVKSDIANGNAPDTSASAAAADPATSVPDPSPASPAYKYWLNERTNIGSTSFERRFVFPEKVDQGAVKASLRNGVLSVLVPKIVVVEGEGEGPRRIAIE